MFVLGPPGEGKISQKTNVFVCENEDEFNEDLLPIYESVGIPPKRAGKLILKKLKKISLESDKTWKQHQLNEREDLKNDIPDFGIFLNKMHKGIRKVSNHLTLQNQSQTNINTKAIEN